MLKPILLCAAFGAVFGSGLAYTQSVPATAPTASMKPSGHLAKIEERFRAADKNGDGALTREEAQAAGLDRVVKHFDQIDANKDGKITVDELRDALRNRARMARISS